MHVAGLHRITLSDGASRLVWAIPRGQILPRAGGPTWDLDADATEPSKLRFRWADVVASLADWLDSYAPPLLVNHGAELTGAESFGMVTGLREVTEADARTAGVDQAGDALYLTIEPRADIVDLFDAGGLPYTSPGLRADYTDDEGRHWPIILRELSFTADPRQKRRQVPTTAAASLAAALLSEVGMDPEIEIKTEVEGDPLKALADVVAALAARVEALEAAKMADVPPVDPAADMSETASLRREIAQLRVSAEVAADLSERGIAPATTSDWVALRVDDPARYKRVIGGIVKSAPRLKTGPATSAIPAAANLSEADSFRARVMAIKARDNCTLEAATVKARQETT